MQLQEHLWREYLFVASAVLTSGDSSVTGAVLATPDQLQGDLLPEWLQQKLRLWQQYTAWQQRQAVLRPLALPKLPVKVHNAASAEFEERTATCISQLGMRLPSLHS